MYTDIEGNKRLRRLLLHIRPVSFELPQRVRFLCIIGSLFSYCVNSQTENLFDNCYFLMCQDACNSSPCHNGGSCRVDNGGAFRCSCTPDFTGELCDTRVGEIFIVLQNGGLYSS